MALAGLASLMPSVIAGLAWIEARLLPWVSVPDDVRPGYRAAKALKNALPLPDDLRRRLTRLARRILVDPARREALRRAHYAAWIERYDTPSDADRAAIAVAVQALPASPLISVVMPMLNPPPVVLERAIAAVRAQLYPHWELCIVADGGAADPRVRAVLEAASAADRRVRVAFDGAGGEIGAMSKAALGLARGEHVALLGHEDQLAGHALFCIAREIARHPEAQLIYCDEDRLDGEGRRFDPFFKPDFSLDLMLARAYLGRFTVFARAAVAASGGLREGFGSAAEYDLALRVIGPLDQGQIRHIPHILVHRRDPAPAPETDDAERRAVADFLARTRPGARVETALGLAGCRRIVHPLPETPPLASLLIPTRDGGRTLARCIDSIAARTETVPYEIVILDNGSVQPRTLRMLAEWEQSGRARVLRLPGPFNFSALNNEGVRSARGEIVVLLNDDTEVITPGWLRELVSHTLRPEVGAVGARLLYPNGDLQHVGVVLGLGAPNFIAGHAFVGEPRDEPGTAGQARLARDVSAVTAACLAMRKAVYLEVGGLDAQALPVDFNDIDLCLRLRQAGKSVIYTPYAELYHHESRTRGRPTTPEKLARLEREALVMRARWGALLRADPFYNPNLTLALADAGLAWPPRLQPPWRG